MNRRIRVAAFTSVGIAVIAAAVTGGYAAAQTGSGGPTPLQPAYVARDRTGDPVLTVRLQQGVGGTGQFYFNVAKVGVWTGVIDVKPAGGSPVVHLRGDVNAMFTANGSNRPGQAKVRMEGTINTAHHSATINIWATRPGTDGQTHYQINTNPPPNQHKAAGAALKAATALQARKWASLYKMAASAITSMYTKAQFVELMSGQHQPQVHSIKPSGEGTFRFNEGVTSFTQEFTFTTIQGAKTTHYTADIIMVWENKAWRFYGTTAPES